MNCFLLSDPFPQPVEFFPRKYV